MYGNVWLNKIGIYDSVILSVLFTWTIRQACIAQLVTCLATDASLTADPGVGSLIRARSNTLVEVDHEIISTDILLPSAE